MATVGGLSLHLERIVPGSRETVFAMHADSLQLARWWGPRGFTAPSAELDVRVGGRIRIDMQPPDGDLFVLVGEFLEVASPQRLSYTFRWEDPDPDDRETVVVFDLFDAGDSTRVVVDHSGFATEARRALHEDGWGDALDRLEAAMRDDIRHPATAAGPGDDEG